MRSDTTHARPLLIGFAAAALVAGVHVVHDLSHDFPLWLSLLSGALLVGQCAVLSLGHALASRWRTPGWVVWTGGLLISAVFGYLILAPHESSHLPPRTIPVRSVVVGLAIGCFWLLVFQLPQLVIRARVHALEVESLRREAELSRLRVHLHPHFLLNTLNAIAGLVTEDAAEARRLLAALGDLVRDALAERDELQPFSVEVAWLRRYADILEARHRGSLSFRWEIAEETLAVPVPRLLLQPLVENALEHGALRRSQGGSVLVRSEAEGGTVRFVVEDNGPGVGREPAEGLGIRLVRRRLALMCPGGTMRFEPTDVGTRVVVEIPKAPEVRR